MNVLNESDKDCADSRNASSPWPIGFALIIADRDALVIAMKRNGWRARRVDTNGGRGTTKEDP